MAEVKPEIIERMLDLKEQGFTRVDVEKAFSVLGEVSLDTDSEGKPTDKRTVGVSPDIKALIDKVWTEDAQIGEGPVFEGIQAEVFGGIQQEKVFEGISREGSNDALMTAQTAKRNLLMPVNPNPRDDDAELVASLLSEEDAFTVDDVFPEDTGPVMTRTREANSELGQVLSPTLEQSQDSIASELSSGSDAPLIEAEGLLQEEQAGRVGKVLTQELEGAQSGEEALEAIERFQTHSNSLINMSHAKESYLLKKLNPTLDRVPRITEKVVDTEILSHEAGKRINKVWENTGIVDVLKDFGEILIPVVGLTEMVNNRWEQSIGEVLDKVAQAPRDKQVEVLNSFIDTWVESETALLENNNSLLTVDRISRLSDAMLEGGLGLIDGQLTQAERNDIFETILDSVFIGTEVSVLDEGIKGLFKLLSRKVFPEIPKPRFKLLEGDVDIYRGPSRTADIEYSEAPVNLLVAKETDGLKKAGEKVGLTQEQVAARVMPTMNPDGQAAFPNVMENQSLVNELILADKDLSNIGMEIGRNLEKVSGNSLSPVISGTRLEETADANSFGNFIVLMGDGNKLGFETAEQAQTAAEWGLLGSDFNIVQQSGGYFVETKVPHLFNAKRDTKDLYTDLMNPINPAGAFFLDPLRVLGEDVLGGVFALKNVNRSKVQKLVDKFNHALSSFTHEKSGHLYKALEKGDENSVEYTTKRKFADAAGVPASKVSDETFNAYKDIREVMDEIYKVRNTNYRNAKVSQNYRMIGEGEEGTLVRPVKAGEEVPPQIYQPSTGGLINSEEAKLILRADTPLVDSEGFLRRYISVTPSELKELPQQLLTKRRGHIDRSYRDTGWTLKEVGRQTVDGAEETFEKTTHIFKTRAQAVKRREAMIAEGRNPDELLPPIRARENSELDTIYGDEQSVQYGYGSSHTKKRGEGLKGVDGLPARTTSIFDSIARSINSAQRDLDLPMIASLEARFIKTLAPYLREGEGTRFSSSLGDMMSLGKGDVPSEVHTTAKQWHNYIKGMRGAEVSQAYTYLDNAIESSISAITGGRVNVPADTAKVMANAQKLTAQLVIVGRPLYQVPQNLFQMSYVAMAYPESGARAVSQIPFVLRHILTNSSDFAMLGKVLGVNTSVAKEVVKDIVDSGLFNSVGRADDFLAMTNNDLTTSASDWFGFYGEKYGLGAVKAPFKASQTVQEHSIRLINLGAYLAELHQQVVKAGKPFNAQTKASISFGAQKLTQTQNGMNQFWYQKQGNIFSPMFQFTQHTHQLFLDVVLDPLIKSVSKGSLGKSTTPLSRSVGAAMFTTASVLTLFGFDGIVGSTAGQAFSDVLRDNFPHIGNNPVADALISGGLINSVFWQAIDGKPDVTAKINPASVIDSIWSHQLKNYDSLDLFGATGSVTSSLLDAGFAVKTLLSSPDMDTREKVINSAREIASVVAGFRDAERAYIAGLTGTWTYNSTLSGPLKIEMEEAIFALFNVTPEMVNEYYYRGNFNPNRGEEPDVDKVSKVFIRAMNREMASIKSSGDESLKTYMMTLEKYVGLTKSSLPPSNEEDVAKNFSRFALQAEGETYKQYFKPHLNANTLEDAVKGLKRLRQTIPTEQGRQEIDDQIKVLELEMRSNTNKNREN